MCFKLLYGFCWTNGGETLTVIYIFPSSSYQRLDTPSLATTMATTTALDQVKLVEKRH